MTNPDTSIGHRVDMERTLTTGTFTFEVLRGRTTPSTNCQTLALWLLNISNLVRRSVTFAVTFSAITKVRLAIDDRIHLPSLEKCDDATGARKRAVGDTTSSLLVLRWLICQ